MFLIYWSISGLFFYQLLTSTPEISFRLNNIATPNEEMDNISEIFWIALSIIVLIGPLGWISFILQTNK